jgi:hypothetical protein
MPGPRWPALSSFAAALLLPWLVTLARAARGADSRADR